MLSVESLRFSYRKGGEELFDGLTHGFAAQAATAVTGPSGRGKSTLLYVLGLLLTPTSGCVRLDDRNVSSSRDSERAWIRSRRIGFVFQDSELDPSRSVLDSVIEPTLYAGGLRDRQIPRALSLLDRFRLADRANYRPGQVSGGQAQRLAVCRALMNDPAVLLADEPTGNLDRDNAALVLDALVSSAHEFGATVIIATHDPFVVARMDQVVQL